MATIWTEQQQMAITAKDGDILVSAAAGSGKTAVLVERIISSVTEGENPLDIDRLLVVTFTKAAASEMSQRIGAAIAKKLESDSTNVHLQNQMAFLSHADIKTIHAFCLQIIQEYYALLDLDPAVRTADPSEITLLQKEVLEDLFEDLYSEDNADFYRLLETYGEATGDNRLKGLILQVYEFAQGYPNPQKLLLDMAEQFALAKEDTINTCSWMGLIGDSIRNSVDYALFLMKRAEEEIEESSDFEAYRERLSTEREAMEQMAASLSQQNYALWHRAYILVDFPRMPAYRGEDKETADFVKDLRNEAKAEWKKMGEAYFCYGEETQTNLIRALYPVAKALSEITILFMKRFAEAKKEKLWIDFHDYEHFCLQVLTEPGSGLHHVVPTEAAKEVQKKYDEIMIDEYQDSNLVQEMILEAVSGKSRGENNRFMVGDVKQSIYRFRLAMPMLFNEKYRTYPTESGGKTRKVILSKNFRSRENVLLGINFLFRQLMREDFGDVAYDEEAALYAGAAFPPCDGLCGGENEIMLMETRISEETELPQELEEMDKRQLEASMIAGKIREMMAEGYEVLDKESGIYRPMEYRDVVVLLRSMKNWGSVLEDVFGKEGIPFFAETAEGYYYVPEVDTILNILRLIDNPIQDIPLLSLLHSPLYGLSADNLAEIRVAGSDSLYYECILEYATMGEKDEIRWTLETFLTDLTRWRQKEKQMSLPELIHYLYRETGYYDYVGMTEGGSLRQANLRLLQEKAEQYESSSRKGLFYFVRYVEQMKTAETESSSAKIQNEGENLVRVMTIHKSKGLEFPVVFVADMGKQFNEMDTRTQVITHQEWGYGMDYTDLEQRAVYKTLCKAALAEAIHLENLSEELRVLYVALTRAKEKLILTGVVKNMEKSLGKWQETAHCKEEQLPIFRLRRGKNYLDWVVPALMRHTDAQDILDSWEFDMCYQNILTDSSRWKWSICNRENLYEAESISQWEEEEQGSIFSHWDTETDYSGNREEIFRILSWKYPFGDAVALPAKVSISEIKRKNAQEISGEEPLPLAVPQFPSFGKKTHLSASQIGTAMHAFMEYADLQKAYTKEDVDALLLRMTAEGKLTEEEAKAVHRKELMTFFASPLAERIRKADRVEKEQPFSMLMEPKEIFWQEEYRCMEELIQVNGIIDCYFYEGDHVVLVDYKSDRIRSIRGFREKYKTQLCLYREALERVTELPVTEVYLYSFAMGKAVQMQEEQMTFAFQTDLEEDFSEEPEFAFDFGAYFENAAELDENFGYDTTNSEESDLDK